MHKKSIIYVKSFLSRTFHFLIKFLAFRRLMYVKVYGTIRVFKEEKAIVGTHIKKIEKFDEVTNHLL